MKKLLILLFSILISFNSYGLFGLFEKTICVETDALYNKKDSFIYLPPGTKPFSGKNLCKYKNGQNKSKGKVKDGKRIGIWTGWYNNGQKEYEGNHKDGKDGKWTGWYKNGQIHFEGHWKNDRWNGKWTFWNENGQKTSEKYYKDDYPVKN